MKEDTFVPTELHTQASAELQKEIDDELEQPEPEHATASFRERLKDSDQD